MALYSLAQDIQTRQNVWIMTNVKNGHQSNSHKESWDWDGIPTAELASLHTEYKGNSV